MRWTPLLLLGCFPEFDEIKGLSFVDNPRDDYDGDGFTEEDGDCNDQNDNQHPRADEFCDEIDNDCNGLVDDQPLDIQVWYLDQDGDGFGVESTALEACINDKPDNFIEEKQRNGVVVFDCDDDDPELHPADYDQDGASSCDGDCDDRNATILDTKVFYYDGDSDGFGIEAESEVTCPGDQSAGYVETAQRNGENTFDCDDTNPDIHPDAQEICDGFDNNCSGEADDYYGSLAPRWYYDGDGDGFGQYEVYQQTCTPDAGYVENFIDCDDTEANAYPGADEVCDGIDNNCNGAVDEPLTIDIIMWYQDSDNDGYGNPSVTQLSCDQPSGFIATAGDCNDLDDSQYPNAVEICNNQDDNCDGNIDEGPPSDAITAYEDLDGDTYGNPNQSLTQCTLPTGYVSNDDDCNDLLFTVHEHAVETCNNIDDDCDGTADNGAIDLQTYYLDQDGDGYGDATQSIQSCPTYTNNVAQAPANYSVFDTDCDDNPVDGQVRSPGNPEMCSNDIDENCDGHNTAGATDVSAFLADVDGDGYGAGLLAPDGSLAFRLDSCIQPYGYIPYDPTAVLDCNDADEWVHPEDDLLHLDSLGNPIDHQELCNGKVDLCENDWNGDLTPLDDEVDHDGDGYVECSLDIDATQWADLSAGVVGGEDCDDNDEWSYPEAPELCNGAFENCSDPLYIAQSQSAPDSELDDDGDCFVECVGFDAATWEGGIHTCTHLDGTGQPVSETVVVGGEDCNDDNANTYIGAAINTPTVCAQDEDFDGDGDCNLTGVGPYYACDYGVFLPSGGAGPDFVLITAGVEPLGRYTLTQNFHMMTTEVTIDMHSVLIPSTFSGLRPWTTNWYGALAYANALSAITGKDLCYSDTDPSDGYDPDGLDPAFATPYDCDGYRLPTEAEWEYAARSGTTEEFWTPDGGGTYPSGMNLSCGNRLDDTTVTIEDGGSNPPLSDYMWWCGNLNDPAGVGNTKPVGLKRPNGFGLFDTQGNAWEFNSDHNGDIGGVLTCTFPESAVDPYCPTDSTDPRTNLRGGYYGDFPFRLGLSAQWRVNKAATNRFGIRLVINE